MNTQWKSQLTTTPKPCPTPFIPVPDSYIKTPNLYCNQALTCGCQKLSKNLQAQAQTSDPAENKQRKNFPKPTRYTILCSWAF